MMLLKTVVVGMLHTNCYIVMDEETRAALVVDPGANVQRILDAAAEMGASIETIVLTHGHFDHVMAAPALQEATGAKLYIHVEEQPMLEPDTIGHRGYIKEAYQAPRIDGFLESGMKLTVGGITFTVLHTPGHSRGSCVLLHEGQGDAPGLMLSGDTLFQEACGRWDLDGGDEGQIMHSLCLLHNLAGDYAVYPGHGEPTTLSHERTYNPYMRRALFL